MFSASREKETNWNPPPKKENLTVALSWCLDFSEVDSWAQEMETKLNQRQTEENREKNQEHFSLEPMQQAGEQQDFGDEQHML